MFNDEIIWELVITKGNAETKKAGQFLTLPLLFNDLILIYRE
jgi:hypothetical protein